MPKMHQQSATSFVFWCPGCNTAHGIDTGKGWKYNGDADCPTIEPSILSSGSNGPECHSYVRDGRIQFLSDCKHNLAGQTVDIPDWDTAFKAWVDRDK